MANHIRVDDRHKVRHSWHTVSVDVAGKRHKLAKFIALGDARGYAKKVQACCVNGGFDGLATLITIS